MMMGNEKLREQVRKDPKGDDRIGWDREESMCKLDV